MADQSDPVYIIPDTLNLGVLFISASASAALLYGASHAPNFLIAALCAIAFSFTANTIFSLLHEAVHGLFSSHKNINTWAGRFAAAWFPTGLMLQRAFHLTHHKNNRSELEQFDILHPGDIKWLKYAQWYGILTGIYWAVSVLGALIYCLLPQVFCLKLLREKQSRIATQTSSIAYLQAVEKMDPWIARAEIAFSVGFQIMLFLLLDLSLMGWLSCYAAFGLNWSSLQYTDHAFSPLDAQQGAWNLRVGWFGRILFLNYHTHLAHHQNPRAPWTYLPSLIVEGTPRPGFFRVWWASWGGPKPIDKLPKFDHDQD